MQIIQIKLYAINANDCQSRLSWQSSTLLTSFASQVKRCWYLYFSVCLHFNMYYFLFVFVFPPSSPTNMLCIPSQTLPVFARILLLWNSRNAWGSKSETIFSDKSTLDTSQKWWRHLWTAPYWSDVPEKWQARKSEYSSGKKSICPDRCLAFVWILGLVI